MRGGNQCWFCGKVFITEEYKLLMERYMVLRVFVGTEALYCLTDCFDGIRKRNC